MGTLRDNLAYTPVELQFGTSGLRGLVTDMTDLECYINTRGFLDYLRSSGNYDGQTIYVAGDLRDSTPRILAAVCQAITDAGCTAQYYGKIPTPALAYFASLHDTPCIMVTGSHIPADRNGIKFYKRDGEVLKADEGAIKQAVAGVRQAVYDSPAAGIFDEHGSILHTSPLPDQQADAAKEYSDRYISVFGSSVLAGKQIVFYQHSAVGRDLLVDILRQLGAEVTTVGRSETFVPIDSENITPNDAAYFRQLSIEHPNRYAIVSTDGDSDRPFVIDEQGIFHRGDVLGAVTADWLGADFAAYPVSSSDAVDQYLQDKHVPVEHTKIGSPHVIVAMQQAQQAGRSCTVGWEVNGGFLVGSQLEVRGQQLAALPTRDALLPIIVALVAADGQGGVSKLFAQLPARFTQAGLIDNFPTEVSRQLVEHFSAEGGAADIQQYFTAQDGFDQVVDVNTIDGVRIRFGNDEIAHMRPSGNAPQLRIYSVADSQERADAIVQLALAEPDGIFRTIESSLGV